jgi:hypothetical protein
LWFYRDATDGKLYTSIVYFQEDQIPVISGMGILRLRGNTGNRILLNFACLAAILYCSEIVLQAVSNKQRYFHKHKPISAAEFPFVSEMIGRPFW